MNETRGLWRGRGTNNWHYGDLIRAESENNHSPIIIENGVRYSVFPDTLGECTGLRDKNGELIFEGDIIDYENGDGIYTYMVAWDNEYSRFAIADNWFGETKIISDFVFYSPSKCTVIGNIHDNLDLLTPNKT